MHEEKVALGHMICFDTVESNHAFCKGPAGQKWQAVLGTRLAQPNPTWNDSPWCKTRQNISVDSVLFHKIDEAVWGAESTISFKVQFDPDKSLKPKHYDIVTPVQLFYYDEYTEDADGVVLSKGTLYTHPLGKVSFGIELPGKRAVVMRVRFGKRERASNLL